MADNNITSSQNQNGDDDARVSSPRQQQQRPQSSEPGRPGSARPASAQPAAAAADDEGKIFISYIVLGVIVTSFVLVTVALGLMAALINLPDCDSTTQRFGRDALVNKNKLTIFKELLDSHKVESARAEYPYCPELLDSPVGQPWNSKRLPGDIVPIRYELMLRTPIFATTMYNGEITIEVEARAATSYIIMHSKFLSDYLPSVRNAAGDELSIACTGDFLPYDYYVIKMASPLSAGATYKIDLYFTGSLIAFANGIFDVKYNLTDSEFEGNMLASHFNPVDARLAFPCFDEPQMKAVFSIRLYHPPGTTALSNSKALSEVQEGDEILTTFEDTPRLPVYLIAMLVFRTADFQSREITGANGVELRVWARRTYVESGSVDGPVKMLAEIFNTFDFIANDVPQALPKKLDVFAIPYYPQDSVGHAGLFIFEESKLLFLENNVQERIKQSIALELAKHIASLWFGSYVTFKWWNELWLQESISDYVKYRAVDRAYPTWRVSEQFITEELIRVLVDDSYPSSHPVIKDVDSPEDIDQLFDSVETSKGAAILRMIEYEVGPFDVYTALISYLKAGAQSGIGDANTFWSALEPIRKWPAKDFADRWLLQANYPIISARIEQHDDGLYYFSASQEKFTSEYSVFSGQEPYPSPFGNVWYIPLTCTFGITPTDGETFDAKFDIDAKTFEGLIGDGTVAYKWVHCDVLFAGYYSFDYSVENWDLLGEVLRADNENLTPQDRANIIHNLFMNTYNGRTSYVQLARELSFLRDETDYLPWKTAVKHVSDMADILEHRRSFLQLSSYFLDGLASVEFSTDLWHATGDHIEELKRETILEFACRMQDPNCLTNTTNLWRETFPTPDITGANTLAPHVRSVVYNYHMQNTYDTSEWRVIVSQYDRIPDIQDRELLVQAISYSRLPWILFRYLDEIGHDQQSFSKLNFFYILELLAKNPLGREIAWNYYRANYAQIVNDFGYENPEIGSTLINIVKTFSDEFNYFELLEFISNTADEANSQARVRAIEIVSSNSVWIDLKEEEIIEAFGGIRRTADQLSPMKRVDKAKLMAKNKQLYDERFTWPLKRKQQQQ